MGHGAGVGGVGLLAVAARETWGARKADWDAGMLSRAGRGGRMAQPVEKDSGRDRRSVVELVGQRRVEYEVWDWLGLGRIEGGSLVEDEVSLWRATSG